MAARNLHVIRKILELRRVQRQAAEQQAARAAATLARLEANYSAGLEQQTTEEASWSKSVSGKSLDLNAAKAWSVQVLDRDMMLRQLSRQIEDAESDKHRRARDLSDASARAEGTEDLAYTLERRWRRRREEALLALVADRVAGRDHHEG